MVLKCENSILTQIERLKISVFVIKHTSYSTWEHKWQKKKKL